MATMLHVRAPSPQGGSLAAAPAPTRGIGSPGAPPAVTVAAAAPPPEAFVVGQEPPPRRGPDTLVGRTLGSYVLSSVLGEGGMGRVYLAEHTLIGRKAAIKVLAPEIATDAEAVSRFFTEARAVNDIRHPNIVEVTDFGQFGALYCIVMEMLEGETLGARLGRARTLDEPAVVRIMKQCTAALGAAHDRGLVHRDIKPENIFLRDHPDYPDFVKLLDFGIAKLSRSGESVGHHTQAGSVIGTPPYMSPEQCLGEAALDFRSDIYSLGVVIYQMVTGRQPFIGDTLGRLIVCHVSEPPMPPSVVNPAVSRPMNDLILRALQKAPGDRFQSAREMREALDRVLAPPQRTYTPIGGVQLGAQLGAQLLVQETLAATPIGAGKRATPTSPAPAVGANAAGVPGFIGVPASGPIAVPFNTGAAGPGASLGARLQEIVRDRAASGRITLPPLPPAIHRCIELARQSRLGFSEAARIIAESPPLRSRVMKLANSAAFPSLMPATTLEMAVGRLGADGLSTALLEMAARDVLEGRHPRVKEAMRRIWPYALGVALMTQEICETIGREDDAANGRLAGLLHDAGKPLVGALLLEIEQQMQRSGTRATVTSIPPAAFQDAIDACHRPFSAALAAAWETPGAVALAITAAEGWDVRDAHALGNVLRFAGAYTKRLGITIGSYRAAETDRVFAEGRALLGLDDQTMKRLGHGFKERTIVLSGIRG